MNIRQIQEAREMYNIDEWGAGYFGINDVGQVVCYPTRSEAHAIPLVEIMQQCLEKGYSTPVIIRFPQLIGAQIRLLDSAFKRAINEFQYGGRYLGVFPFKVNQRREFIDQIVQFGAKVDWGLEVGSKAECLAAMSYQLSKDALFILNGFKDHEFIEMGFVAKQLGKNVIIVIESPEELLMLLDIAERYPSAPEIGLRIKLYAKSSGKWQKSSGEASKFGLTTTELMHCLAILKDRKREDLVSMLHFHIGSQITEIKRIKNAVKEASRVYAKTYKMGFKAKYLNVGGGVGVDYDGSKTTFQSSANYTIQEFANDAVYVIREVCEQERVEVPTIVSESGRVVAAYHSIVVTDIREVQSPNPEEKSVTELYPNFRERNYPRPLTEMFDVLENINRKNYSEFYHDAIEYYEELFTLFNLGHASLEERSIAEDIFSRICRKAIYYSTFQKHPEEEFMILQKQMVSKYMANFSIFQSIPDAWSIDQLFPVMPLTHHHVKPDHKATIIDITCDSDGCLDKFIDRADVRTELDLHTMPEGEDPYYLGFFLVGAYQESLANEHNLFGATNEVEVQINEKTKSWKITKFTQGDPIAELLQSRNYNVKEILKSIDKQLTNQMEKGGFDLNLKGQCFHLIKNVSGKLPYLTRDGGEVLPLGKEVETHRILNLLREQDSAPRAGGTSTT
jgi:arginine decarboxylase